MNLHDALLQVRSNIREAVVYLNDHEIIRGYRAIERAFEGIDKALAISEA